MACLKSALLISVFVLFMPLAALCQEVNQTPPDVPAAVPAANNIGHHSVPALQERNPRYILQPGDSFDVSFDLSPEFNQSLTIQPDGFVTLRGVGGARDVTYRNLPNASYIGVRASFVRATGTTATDLIGEA